jgi:hypothetical protein
MPDRSSTNDPFYVGYLPAPEEHARFVRTLVVLVLLWMLGVAGIVAMTMRDPGDAVWMTSNERTWTGTIRMLPYPMIVPRDDPQNPLLIVSIGKHGAHERLDPFDDAFVQIRGWELHRDGRRLIELAEDDGAILRVEGEPSDQALAADSRAVTLVGEIVDGKCFLGAMKPGDGFAHRSCAVLCLRGKLPPMFATIDADGKSNYHLLVVDGTSELSENTLELVALRVQIEGRLTRPYKGLSMLTTTEQGISRID